MERRRLVPGAIQGGLKTIAQLNNSAILNHRRLKVVGFECDSVGRLSSVGVLPATLARSRRRAIAAMVPARPGLQVDHTRGPSEKALFQQPHSHQLVETCNNSYLPPLVAQFVACGAGYRGRAYGGGGAFGCCLNCRVWQRKTFFRGGQ